VKSSNTGRAKKEESAAPEVSRKEGVWGKGNSSSPGSWWWASKLTVGTAVQLAKRYSRGKESTEKAV